MTPREYFLTAAFVVVICFVFGFIRALIEVVLEQRKHDQEMRKYYDQID